MTSFKAEVMQRISRLDSEIEALTSQRDAYERVFRLVGTTESGEAEDGGTITNLSPMTTQNMEEQYSTQPHGGQSGSQVPIQTIGLTVPQWNGNKSGFVKDMIAQNQNGVSRQEIIQSLCSVAGLDKEVAAQSVYNTTSRLCREKRAREANGKYFPSDGATKRRSGWTKGRPRKTEQPTAAA